MRVRTAVLGTVTAGVLFGGLAGGLALMVDSGESAVAQEPGKRERATRRDEFRSALAARLGVTPEALIEAIRDTKAQFRAQDGAARREQRPDRSAKREAAQQPAPDRRAILEALARLANLSPQELRTAAEQHGGVLQALDAHGVGREAVLDELTRLIIVRFEPAIEQGRLTREQAEQLARRQARRLMQRLGQGAPNRQR